MPPSNQGSRMDQQLRQEQSAKNATNIPHQPVPGKFDGDIARFINNVGRYIVFIGAVIGVLCAFGIMGVVGDESVYTQEEKKDAILGLAVLIPVSLAFLVFGMVTKSKKHTPKAALVYIGIVTVVAVLLWLLFIVALISGGGLNFWLVIMTVFVVYLIYGMIRIRQANSGQEKHQ